MNAKRLFALGNQRRHNDRVAIQPPQDKTPAQPVHFQKKHRLGNVHAKQQQQQQQQQRQKQRQQQQQQQRQQQQQQQRQRQEMQKLEDRGITFKIQTTKYLLNIANSLKSILHNMKFSASVMSSEEISREIEREIPGVHYIFLCIGHMFHLPKKSKYYIYNLEQVNYHPDFPLLGLVGERTEFITTAFKNATNIFDYSEMNITNYPEDFKNKALYLPVPLFEGTKSKVTDIEKEYDVLFFGGLNDRRNKILKYLKKNMNVRIVTNVFGDALYDIIKKSRIVLNIHFKGESLLETARIHDCITHSTPLIISEESIDMDTMEEYKEIVKFVPVIKEDLSNMDELIEGIQKLLINGDVDNTRLVAERKMQDMIKKRFNYFKIYKYPSLFHKYLLGISTPNKPITYELIQPTPDKTVNKLFAHLHCYDISKFNEIYSEYIEKICSFFKVVITYSIGKNNINDKRFVIIKIPNKGMDIGAKFCMVQYLNDNNISYEYIFFLHSKSNIETRRKYFLPLIENLNEGFIDNINNYDGYFPDIQWQINGNKLKMISGNPKFANSNLPERNLENINDLLGYLGCENRTNRFVEGNVYILSKKIVERLFGDKKLYNILNGPDDFDYNWVRKRYGLSGGVNNVYNDFKTKNLPPRDKLSYDGYTEHAFERVVLNCVDESKIKIIKSQKVCIIYVYYERKNEQKNQTNLSFFIKYGLDKSRWRDIDITTLFIINGKQCEVLIPERKDIFVLKEDNCSDWEGWFNGIKYFENKYKKPIYESFSHLCLINASSFGPVYEDGTDRHWLDETIYDKKYYIHNIKPSKDDYNMRVINSYNNVTFGKFDEQFLKIKLNYENAIIDISNYKECFNKENKKCLIYAHFDKDNLIKNYVIESLIIFSQIGYDIVFYTTSTSINNYDESFLPFKIKYVSPYFKSGGDDWFMWLKGCKILKEQNRQYDWIMLANDSMLFGINGIENMRKSISNIESRDIDFWGHWDSNEISYHIMSSLYEFKYELLDHFIKFTETNLFACKSKHEVVLKCETKLTIYLQSLGFKTSSIINKDSYLFQPPEIFRYNINNVINCPSHNPLNVSSWINNEFSFGIKWKYILYYLKECNLNNELKERLRHIHIHRIGKYLGALCHFPLIPVNLYRDNNIFGNEKKIFTIVKFKQKYQNAEKIQFL